MVNEPHNQDELAYQVMPQGGQRRVEPVNTPPKPPVNPTPTPNSTPGPISPELNPEPGLGHSRIVYIVVGIVVLVVVGALIYFLVGSKTEDPQASTQQLPKTWLTKYFNKEVCDDVSTCGDEADPDSDGLTNFDEFKKSGTSLTNPDTDGDGIADGDELNIYKTDPTDKFTDKRQVAVSGNFTDGHQIKNGYDPLTPGIKFTETRLQQIAQDQNKFGLHEPTKTTFSTTAAPSAKTVNITIENNKFNPSSQVVNKGDTVVWLNKDIAKHHIVSDPHPAHTSLPGLESTDLGQNQTYTFVFDTTGTFSYHDELNPQIKGSIEVK